MMLMIFSVRDVKSNSFNSVLHIKPTRAAAVRDFTSVVNSPESGLLNQYPEDFELYHVGDFDDEKGFVVPIDPPVRLVSAADIKS